MKASLSLLMLLTFISCGHLKKANDPKTTYSPVLSFTEENKKFEAKISLPKDFKDKIPLIIIVHEWWGRNYYVMNRSQMLNDPQLGISRLSQYLELAKLDPHVDATKVYVIGYCFGGTQALNLARRGADIKGVVSFHGGLASSIASTGIKAQILALNGLADPMFPGKERAGFEKEMKSLKANYKMVNYKGATHAFSNPKATEVGKKYKIPVAYNKKADEASWKEFIRFLKK